MRLLKRQSWALILGLIALAGGLWAAPFAEKIPFVQPDGTAITLWGEGDEFYAVFETLDGYTVVFDTATKAYYYAGVSADGTRLVSTGLEVGKGEPKTLGLKPHVRISDQARSDQARARYEKWDLGVKQSERWKAVKEERLLAEKALKAGDPSLAPPSFTTIGHKKGLVLLIDFDDAIATVPQAHIVDFCNADNYTGYGNNGSVKKYYLDNSNNLLIYSNAVTAYIRIPSSLHLKSWYNDTSKDCGTQANLLIRDAIAIMRALPNYATEILPQFADLTLDVYGNIAYCNVLYAGGNGGVWMGGLWPHSWSLYEVGPQALSQHGTSIMRYQITNIGGTLTLGTFCHENGHMMCGYPDLYDYGYDSIGGAGRFCLMGHGGDGSNPAQICAYLKYASGWCSTVDVTPVDSIEGTLEATIGSPGYNHIYRYAKPGTDTEYFLFENRQQAGRDASLPASGIAIWHVDELGNKDNQSLAYNTTHANYECTLVQADNQWHFQKNANSGDANDLYYTGNTAAGYAGKFSDGTSPSARWWDGSASKLEARDFSAPAPVMTFSISPQPPTMLFSGALPDGRVGTPYSLFLTAVGGAQPYTWSLGEGALPLGLTIGSDGTLSGLPEEAIEAAFSLIVAGANGAAQTNDFSLTIKPAFTQPFVETFENGGKIPEGWTQEFVTGGLTWGFDDGSPKDHPFSAHGGTYNACLFLASNTPQTTRLVSPRIVFGAEAPAARLTFWHYMEAWMGSQDTLSVYYKTDYEGEWLLLETYNTSVGSWTQRTIDLPLPVGDKYYFAFEGTAKYGYGICIDDLKIWDPTPPLGIKTASALPVGIKDEPYSVQLEAEGGKAPYSFEIIAGSLPDGLTMDAEGLISGEPVSKETREFVVQLTDDNGTVLFKVFSLTVELRRAALFYEDFENRESPGLPNGWTQELITNGVSWEIQTGGKYGHPEAAAGGVYNAFLWAEGVGIDHKTRLISPAIDLGQAPAAIRMTFWHCMEVWASDQDELRVYYKNTPAAAWTLLATYTENTPVWTQRSMLLPDPTSTYYLAFEGNARMGFGICLDNIEISDEAEAPIITTATILPSGLLGIPYSAQLAAVGGIAPYTWSVVEGALPSGLNLDTVSGEISGTPDLAGNALFKVRVLGDDGRSSTNHFSLRITTARPIPFTETFENGGVIPFGWTQTRLMGATDWQFRSGSPSTLPLAAHGGQYNACLYYASRTEQLTQLISPKLDLGTNTPNTRLTFWHHMEAWGSDQDELRVYYRASETADWTLLATYVASVAGWTQQTVELPNPSEEYFVMFEGKARWGRGVCIDDVLVTGDITGNYESWRSENFTPEEIADGLITGDFDDPDGDGVPNGLEYAMGLDPRTPDTVGLPSGGVESGHLIYTYRENKDATDVIFVVEACTSLSLQDWTTNGVSEILRGDSNTWWQVTTWHDTPILAAPQRFLRLKVYLP
jgi:M6 family metalloprotease-like protein